MLDIKFIRENTELVIQSLINRNQKLDIGSLIAKDDERRKILSKLEELRSERNKANDQISALLKEKKDAKDKIFSMKSVSEEISLLEKSVKDLELDISKSLISIPNIPHSSVPIGAPEITR